MTSAVQFRQQLAAATFLSHIGPIKEDIRRSALAAAEQVQLLAEAEAQEDLFYQRYMGRQFEKAAERKRGGCYP